MEYKKGLCLFFAVCSVLTLFFSLLFYADNKYETPPPYGKSGVILLNEKNLNRNTPIYLIDGWLLTDASVTDKPTYIGEFSNLGRGHLGTAPHGWASYRLTLRYNGAPQIMSVFFPRLSSSYTISLDGTQLTQGVGNGQITFLLTAGEHTLMVNTTSRLGYYSGMYFPPVLGAPEVLAQMSAISEFAYALAFILPISLAVFTLLLWRTGGAFSRRFGLLCLFYALYVSRYFVFALPLPMAKYWFLAESLALYGLCFGVIALTATAANATDGRTWQYIRAGMLLFPAVLLILCLLIPVLPWAVFFHGRLTDMYYIFTFCIVVYFALPGIAAQSWEGRYTLTGCGIFGVGLMLNLFFSNQFEPILFFWQFEWCGLFLVLLFGAMMVERNRRILQENNLLTNHLEAEVARRTLEIKQLLEERKAFFSDMAHDLKAPVFATQAFIEAIRRGGVGVDSQLRCYLDQAESKQNEMARRLQGLSTIGALDKIESPHEKLSVCVLISDIYAAYHAEAVVKAVHFAVKTPEQDGFLLVQPQKLDILFENLIYNALRATAPDGSITVSARLTSDKAVITVADTGCGIPQEELPYIFRRFFVGKRNKETGTGLGLYIVKTIVEEMSGNISVISEEGKGTSFIMEFPLI